MKKLVIASIATLAMVTAASAAEVNLKACAGCHGMNFEKHAMGKSKVVKDMSKADVAAALIGYKDGTYGGPMKGIMKGQVAKYSEAELKAAAEKIGK